MSVEVFLARLYVDAGARAEFAQDPRGVAQRAGLSAPECESLCRIDREGLEFAARSFAAKRSPLVRSWAARVRLRCSRLFARSRRVD